MMKVTNNIWEDEEKQRPDRRETQKAKDVTPPETEQQEKGDVNKCDDPKGSQTKAG